MTTIAWDGKILASDSLATSAGMVVSTSEKKIFRPGDDAWSINKTPVVAFASSGDCGAEFEIADRLKEGITYGTQFSGAIDFTCIFITRESDCFLAFKDAGSEIAKISAQDGPYAIGSGGVMAMTAMHLGRNAIEAVEAAICLDVCTGGNIDYFMPADSQ